MQISAEKLQSTRHVESLRRTSLIRSTFLQSRKHFSDLMYSLIKISSTNHSLLPVMIADQGRSSSSSSVLPPCEQTILTWNKSSKKRKSCHMDTVKRLRLTASATSNATQIEQENIE